MKYVKPEIETVRLAIRMIGSAFQKGFVFTRKRDRNGIRKTGIPHFMRFFPNRAAEKCLGTVLGGKPPHLFGFTAGLWAE